MATYNGHKNFNHWNVSLWINNDEGLYRLAQAVASGKGNAEGKAKTVLQILNEQGVTKTPDGTPYSVTTIKAAMRDM